MAKKLKHIAKDAHGRPVGRPPKFTDQELLKIVKDFEKYIIVTPFPTIVGFTTNYCEIVDEYGEIKHLLKENICERPEFSHLVKKAVEKQEQYLIAKTGEPKQFTPGQVFLLKQPQHGYTDKQDINANIHGKVTTVIEIFNEDKEDGRDTAED